MSFCYTLEKVLKNIKTPDYHAAELAKERLDSIIKPLGSLGKMEEHFIKIASLTGSPNFDFARKAVVVFCADNGVVAQNITQSAQEVTAIVAANLTTGDTCVCAMARVAGADIIPVDIGIAQDVFAEGLLQNKIAYGTKDFSKEPAMTKTQAIAAIEVGINLAAHLKQQGYTMLATGEMGIGNTATSSAMAAVFLDKPVELVTGRGAGLTAQGVARKIAVITSAIQLHQPDPNDPLDVLCKLGGFDIAGMAGLCIGGAAFGVPIVLDGFISSIAAMVACKICPDVHLALLASHVSAEPAGQLVLEALELSALLEANFRLGEGTGAVATFPLYDMVLQCYNTMVRFEDENMQPYEVLV